MHSAEPAHQPPRPPIVTWLERAALVGICTLTIGIYALIVRDLPSEFGTAGPAKAYYNLLVDGFRAGQLNLKRETPTGLRQLADPYDPVASQPYRGSVYRNDRLHDLSYYHGKLYLYFGVTPALVLFWPAVALTGHYISHAQAVVIFASLGLIVSVGLLHAVWRRYFPRVSVVVVCAGTLALGFATSLPLLLQRPEVWEVPICCGYALTMLTLAALWKAWHEPLRRGRWLGLASLAYGLAIGARPSLLFGAVILLGPVMQTWMTAAEGDRRRWRETMRLALAAMVPIAGIGLGLLVYNYLRFDSPFEFGQSHQLADSRQDNVQHFSLDYLWFNLRVYFWAPASWHRVFPYLHPVTTPPFPPHHGGMDYIYGVLTNTPFVWLALAAPLAWWRQTREHRAGLRGLVMSAAVLFGISALLMGLFYGACLRYQTEFMPVLVLLAVVGLLGLEAALADQSRWRTAARLVWGTLWAYSVAFSLLYGYNERAALQFIHGQILLGSGENRAAIVQLNKALDNKPDFDAPRFALAVAYVRDHQLKMAQAQFEQALRLAKMQDVAMYYGMYGMELVRGGHPEEGLVQLEAGFRLNPNSAMANNDLGTTLATLGREPEALHYLEEAVRLVPDFADAQCNLGHLLTTAGRWDEAIGHLRQALRIDPLGRDAHFWLATALLNQGQVPEAIAHYEEALRIDPNFAPAREGLQQLGRPVPPGR